MGRPVSCLTVTDRRNFWSLVVEMSSLFTYVEGGEALYLSVRLTLPRILVMAGPFRSQVYLGLASVISDQVDHVLSVCL